MKKDNFELTWPRYWRTLRVNYNATLAELLAGYDEAPTDVNEEHFPGLEAGEREIQIGLVRFEVFPGSMPSPSNYVWLDPAEARQYSWLFNGNMELAKRKLRHASLKELLTLGLLRTRLTAYRSIVALQQNWYGRKSYGGKYFGEAYLWVPMIRCERKVRRVSLTWTPGFDHEMRSVEMYIAVVRL